MEKISYEEYKRLVQEQGDALIDVIQSVALHEWDAEIEIPEGVGVLSDLAVGLGMMVDDIREMVAQVEESQQEIIRMQQKALQELATPIIPIMDRIIILPLIGSIDSQRARDIMRTLLAGIREYRASVVIIDITGVEVIDSGVANHLDKTIRAARLKGAQTILTGISDAVAETIVDLGIDWSGITTLNNMQAGLVAALRSMGVQLTKGIEYNG